LFWLLAVNKMNNIKKLLLFTLLIVGVALII
ncbi:uncharacterized protein METZ01_LOCUS433497, partial [marine metagenome]